MVETSADAEHLLMDSIGSFHHPRLQGIFKAMMAADKQHVEALAAALAKLSTSSEGRASSEGRG